MEQWFLTLSELLAEANDTAHLDIWAGQKLDDGNNIHYTVECDSLLVEEESIVLSASMLERLRRHFGATDVRASCSVDRGYYGEHTLSLHIVVCSPTKNTDAR